MFPVPCLESTLYFNENVPFPSEISNTKTRNFNSGKNFPVTANKKQPLPLENKCDKNVQYFAKILQRRMS